MDRGARSGLNIALPLHSQGRRNYVRSLMADPHAQYWSSRPSPPSAPLVLRRAAGVAGQHTQNTLNVRDDTHNVLRLQLPGQRARESDDGAFRRDIVHHRGRATERGHGRRVNDTRLLCHVRQRESGHREHLEDVAPERALDLKQVDVRKVPLQFLLARVVHKNVDAPKLLDVHGDHLVRIVKILEVECDRERAPALVLNCARRVFCILLLIRQVYDRDVCPLAREEDNDCTADPRAVDSDGLVGATPWRGTYSPPVMRAFFASQLSYARVWLGTAPCLKASIEWLGFYMLLQSRHLLLLRRDPLLQGRAFVCGHGVEGVLCVLRIVVRSIDVAEASGITVYVEASRFPSSSKCA